MTDERAARWLAEHDLEPVGQYDPDTGEGERIVIRRRVSAEGKSSAARERGERHCGRSCGSLARCCWTSTARTTAAQLMDETRHRDYLDGFAGLAPQLERQRQAVRGIQAGPCGAQEAGDDGGRERERRERELPHDRRRTGGGEHTARARRSSCSPRRELLRNSEKLTEALDAAYEALYGGEDSAAEQAGDASGWTERAASLAPELDEALAEIEQRPRALIEDAAERLRDFRESLDFSPGEYDALETQPQPAPAAGEKIRPRTRPGSRSCWRAAQRGLEELDGSAERRARTRSRACKKGKSGV